MEKYFSSMLTTVLTDCEHINMCDTPNCDYHDDHKEECIKYRNFKKIKKQEEVICEQRE